MLLKVYAGALTGLLLYLVGAAVWLAWDTRRHHPSDWQVFRGH